MSKSRHDLPQGSRQRRRDTIIDVIWRWVGNDFYTVQELAEIADCTSSTMYAYLEERRNFPWKRARRIANHASEEHGLNDLSMLLLDRKNYQVAPREEGEADGCMDWETAQFGEAMGMLRAYHREGDAEGMTEQIRRILETIPHAQAERDRLL